MKVVAYRVQCCDQLVQEDCVVGIIPSEDIFDKENSYPCDFKHPERCYVHICLDCYKTKVLIPASQQVDRRKNERLYELKVKELSFSFRESAVKAWQKMKKNGLRLARLE